MAVAANIEWKLEAAWVAVLTANADLASAAVRRFRNRTADVDEAYQIIVQAHSAQDEEFAVLSDYSAVLVDLRVMTFASTDATCETINDLLGACRDTCYGASLIEDLTNAVTGLNVYGALINTPTMNQDDAHRNVRLLTVEVHASARDSAVIENSSSSSSSSSTS